MTRARDLAAGTFELATGGVLKLETSDTTVTDGSVLGKIEFKAPDEASGTDAILVGAAIEAIAEGTFAADNNATELVFKTGASAAADAKMILDSSGNLLVGTTDTSLYNNTSGSGIMLAASGRIDVARVQDVCSILNRTGSSDGSIINFAKNGTTVGSIGNSNGSSPGDLFICSTTSGHAGLSFGGGPSVTPTNNAGALSDNTVDLGLSSHRFKDLYLSGGAFLGGTGAANKLDDYEEGTWTPAFNNVTVSYTERYGKYTKIGDTVHLWGYMVISSINNSDGSYVNIGGMPFTSTGGFVNGSFYNGSGNSSLFTTTTLGAAWTIVSQNYFYLGIPSSTNNLQYNQACNSSGRFWFAMTYPTAS